jgi:hypothetical protein
MARLGFAYACVGRPSKVSALVENVSLNELMSPARERASNEEVA